MRIGSLDFDSFLLCLKDKLGIIRTLAVKKKALDKFKVSNFQLSTFNFTLFNTSFLVTC